MSAQAADTAIVVDTNVWISGLLSPGGAPARVASLALHTGRPVFTTATFAELEERLWKPKFDRYTTLERRRRFLADLSAIARWVDVPPAIAKQTLCRDPADDMLLHAALTAEARWLITGDQDLLVLAERAVALGVRIVSPADALRQADFLRV